MEGGALSLDCEDMFKEITKKLYGEEGALEFPAAERDDAPEEQLTAWGLAALMQNGFPPPGILAPNFAPRTDPAHEDRWTAADEPLAWAQSRVAAYNPAQRLFKCAECECVGFLARVAEHWLGTHAAARAFCCPLPGCGWASSWARGVRAHLARDHRADPAAAEPLLRDNPALADLTRYLQRLKAKVETMRTDRRPSVNSGAVVVAQTTLAAPAAVPAPAETVVPGPAADGDAGKRYVCNACPYATDRRDLFTRHENIHRDEKPFHCYLCHKQFNRADHVKKHFLRMHRDQPYDLNRIRRPAPHAALAAPASHAAPAQHSPAAPQPHAAPPKPLPAPAPAPAAPSASQLYYKAEAPTVLEFRGAGKAERAAVKAEPQKAPVAPPATAPTPQAAAKRKGGGAGERRYACGYCGWAGADNWCLKRHVNTHLKPFACALCEYKAARAERLHTHLLKVHGKRPCAKCAFLADSADALAAHLRDAHHVESRGLKVPGGARGISCDGTGGAGAAGGAPSPAPRRRAAGAARLFGYLEASDGSGDEFEAGGEFAAAAPFRDKENAAPAPPLPDHCLRY